MTKLLGVLLLIAADAARAQWQADAFSGQDDALGILLFFFAFVAYAYVRDEFKISKDKGYKALLICAAILLAAIFIPLVRYLAAILFLAGLVNFIWRNMTGRG